MRSIAPNHLSSDQIKAIAASVDRQMDRAMADYNARDSTKLTTNEWEVFRVLCIMAAFNSGKWQEA